MKLTKDIVDALYEYEDGSLKPRTTKSPVVGTDAKGYKVVSIKGKIFKEHRMIFLMFHGYLPEMVDHIDGDPSNNRIENLRECDFSSNGYNRKRGKNNSSGAKNVCWVHSKNKWKVDLQVAGKRKFIGYFEDFELAELVALEARNKYHREYAKHE